MNKYGSALSHELVIINGLGSYRAFGYWEDGEQTFAVHYLVNVTGVVSVT